MFLDPSVVLDRNCLLVLPLHCASYQLWLVYSESIIRYAREREMAMDNCKKAQMKSAESAPSLTNVFTDLPNALRCKI
jgi:hypothetical protein